MKTRFVTSLILALGSVSAAAQPSPAAPAQQVQEGAPSPAPTVPAAPAAPSALPPPARPVYITPRGYVPPPQRYAPPPVLIAPRPYAPRPKLPPPPPPPPRVYGNAGAPFSLGIGGALVWRNEDHTRFGNDDFVGGVNAFASYDVWAPSRMFVLAAGLDYRHDERKRTSLGRLKDNLLSADLTARVRATSWLWPQLRAGVGVALTRVEVEDDLAGIDLDDRDAGVAGSFGAGLLLRTPTRALESHRGSLSSLSLGVLVEGGYTVAKDASLAPEPARGGDVRRASPAAFTAERSAAYLRILAVIRF
ncbi:MAG TPA: hypothetical protein VFX59_28345 [Polyangiales bacterium]|nr:hypothetical protein [Polyangiales bacterium]